jgi:serine/threonine-protein kinase
MNPQAPSAEALVGTVLDGAYRVDGLLGKGGMGAVYTATHLRLGKRVAVKVMARELAENSEALLRFHREALVTSGLGHPHIVQVFDFSSMPTGEPFLVMEFLEGEDLDQRLRRDRRLSPSSTLRIIKQVASALAATHAKEIVHRDLKPANIYLLVAAEETDFVKVLDFGISKVRAATTKLTRAESVMGTPDYMSPEQALGAIDEIDARTDQWALACITWECLSGSAPFVGENVPSLLFQVVHEQPQPLTPKVPGLSPAIEDVLRRALSKKKTDRFPSVSAFAAALDLSILGKAVGITEVASSPRTELLPGVGDSTAANSVGPKSTTFTQTAGELGSRLDSPASRSRWIWAAASGLLIVLLAAGFLLLRPRPGSVAASAPPTPAFAKPVEQPQQAAPPVPPALPAEPASVPAAAVTAAEEPTAQGRPGSKAAHPRQNKAKGPARPGTASGPASAPSPRPKVDRKLIEDL